MNEFFLNVVKNIHFICALKCTVLLLPVYELKTFILTDERYRSLHNHIKFLYSPNLAVNWAHLWPYKVMKIDNTCVHNCSQKINPSCLHFSLGILHPFTPEFSVGIMFEPSCISSLFITVFATSWMCVNVMEEFSSCRHGGTMIAFFSVQRSGDKNCSIKFEIGTAFQIFIDTEPPWGWWWVLTSTIKCWSTLY